MKSIFQVLIGSMFLLFLVSCGSSSESDSPSSVYNQVNMTHTGVDFSENKGEYVDWEVQDGYIGVWSATNDTDNLTYWYVNNVGDDSATYYYLKLFGEVSLDSIKSVDTSAWPAFDTKHEALKINSVYLIKVKDGYVKFKVLSFSDWKVKVEYKYTSTTSF